MNSATPESNPDKPQPLDYASPGNRRIRGFHWSWWCLLALIPFVLIFGFLFLAQRHSESAYRLGSACNLLQIGHAIVLYTKDHQGEYPDSFQTIVLTQDLPGILFVSIMRSETPADGPTPQAIANQMAAGGHVSYIYLGRGLSVNTVTPNTILAYEMIPHAGGGTNVLFGDGHVEWVGPVTAAKVVSCAATGRFPVTLPTNGGFLYP